MLVITLVALALAPVASRLVANIGNKISSEVDGGRTGHALHEHLDDAYEGALADEEIAQLIEARAFVRGEPPPDVEGEVRRIRDAALPTDDPELREEVRQVVVAINERRLRGGEPELDVEIEVARRLARLLGTNGH